MHEHTHTFSLSIFRGKEGAHLVVVAGTSAAEDT